MEQNSNGKDTSIAVVLMAMILMVIVPIIFERYFFPQYAAFMFYTRYWFFSGLSLTLEIPAILNNTGIIFFWLDWFYIGGKVDEGNLAFYVIKSLDFLNTVDTRTHINIAKSITDNEGSLLSNFIIISRLQSAFFAPLYIFLFYKVYKKILTKKEFNTVFTLDSFAETMSGGIKELLPVVFDNPQKWGSLDEGHWRMSPKIRTYLENAGCIDEEETDNGVEFSLNTPKLRRLLVGQLGDKWTGFENLSQEKRFLIASAMPMAVSPARGKKRTEALVECLAEAHSSKPGFSGIWGSDLRFVMNPFNAFKVVTYIEKLFAIIFPISAFKASNRKRMYYKKAVVESNAIINELKDEKKIKECISSHAYELTVIARVIEEAWKGGVLPSCSMIWLKKKDRNLFYMFNNLGRSVAWIEVCGFWGHFLAEKTTNMPYPYPMLDNTIYGIDKYLIESFYGYRPIHTELLDTAL